MGIDANGDAELEAARAAAIATIVNSEADKKLVVAGPGTGKTFTFKQALQAVEGKGLALTFINNLVGDLKEALGGLADVFTFHGYCKRQMHLNTGEGRLDPLDYYPPFLELAVYDLGLLGRADLSKDDVTSAFHNVDDEDELLTDALRIGDYYRAVSHTDVVYRVLRFFEARDDRIQIYPLIVVDEYQDFSLLETRFIALLATKSPVLIAGDDDQALYAFKNASPRYIRELRTNATYAQFELPYCSRCTDVVVSATKDAIAAATANGNLIGRIEKEFLCYLPDKRADSEAHPRITHARCTVERNNAPYIGRYITKQISEISADDIRESHEHGYPTVLVIGPRPFLTRAYDMIRESYSNAILKTSDQPNVELLDGYRRLAQDDRSRLGWRIIIHCDPFDNANDVLREVLNDDSELVDSLPQDYRERHLEIAALVRSLQDGHQLTDNEEQRLCQAVGASIDAIRETLKIADERDEDDEAGALEDDAGETAQEDAAPDKPSIICTSLVGAKGLSGGYVYIVGCNNGHFPQNPNAITDEEVCCFLVALSRTRKECQLISCNNFSGNWMEPSRLLNWIETHVDETTIDAAWFNAH